MNEALKKDFFDIENDFPFLSADYFKFFKYTRHNDFLRYLDQPKFYKNLVFHEFQKINQRSANAVSIDRNLFIQICKHRKIDTTEIEEVYIQFLKVRTKKSTEHFPNLKKDEKHTLNMYNRPAGKYYAHSLNTINLAEALNLDPYEVYKYCVTEIPWKHGAYNVMVVNSYLFNNKDNIPFLNYDSTDSEYSLSYINLIRLFIKEYPLSALQLELAEHYEKCIIALVKKVYQINHKKAFNRENKQRLKAKVIEVFSKQQLKTLLREGAKLFHPDKNPEGLELFKTFNKHYMNLDGSEMKNMIESYKINN